MGRLVGERQPSKSWVLTSSWDDVFPAVRASASLIPELVKAYTVGTTVDLRSRVWSVG